MSDSPVLRISKPKLSDYMEKWSSKYLVPHEQERSAREEYASDLSRWHETEIERLRAQLAEWIKANGPGGWIDNLRKGLPPETPAPHAYPPEVLPTGRWMPAEETGAVIECDMRITIASDTDEKVTDCFRSIDDALTEVSELHGDVVLTIQCVTVPAQETLEPLTDPLKIAMQAGSWFDRKDLSLPQREVEVAKLVRTAQAVEYCRGRDDQARPAAVQQNPIGFGAHAQKANESHYCIEHNEAHDPLTCGALEYPRYSCFVDGCPGNHPSKYGVCSSPADLVGALQDKVHQDIGAVRPARAVKECPKCEAVRKLGLTTCFEHTP